MPVTDATGDEAPVMDVAGDEAPAAGATGEHSTGMSGGPAGSMMLGPNAEGAAAWGETGGTTVANPAAESTIGMAGG